MGRPLQVEWRIWMRRAEKAHSRRGRFGKRTLFRLQRSRHVERGWKRLFQRRPCILPYGHWERTLPKAPAFTQSSLFSKGVQHFIWNLFLLCSFLKDFIDAVLFLFFKCFLKFFFSFLTVAQLQQTLFFFLVRGATRKCFHILVKIFGYSRIKHFFPIHFLTFSLIRYLREQIFFELTFVDGTSRIFPYCLKATPQFSDTQSFSYVNFVYILGKSDYEK